MVFTPLDQELIVTYLFKQGATVDTLITAIFDFCSLPEDQQLAIIKQSAAEESVRLTEDAAALDAKKAEVLAEAAVLDEHAKKGDAAVPADDAATVEDEMVP